MNNLLIIGLSVMCLGTSNGQLFPFQPGQYRPVNQQAANAPPNAPFSVSCYSNGVSPGQCPAPGRIIEARVARQRSGGACSIYKSFGFVGNYLWVRDGCGGDFVLRYATNELAPNFYQQQQQQQQQQRRQGVYPNNGYPSNGNPNNGYPYNQPLNNQPLNNQNCPSYNARYPCASVNNGYNLCKVPYEIVRVDVKQPYGRVRCQFAENYGRTENGKIWVTNGCSAKFDVTFKVCQGSGDSNCKVSSTLVDCRANQGSYTQVTECELRFQVNSIQLSNRNTALNCNQASYGQNQNGVWVNNGCYGTFDVNCQIC